MSNPQIFVEDQPLQDIKADFGVKNYSETSRDAPLNHRHEDLPLIDANDTRTPEELLRAFSVTKSDIDKCGFWSLPLLRCILTRDRILKHLKECAIDASYVENIRPKVDPFTDSKDETYLQIFALLLLLERESDIGNFIKEHVCDQSLPVQRYPGCSKGQLTFSRRNTLHESLNCFRTWKVCDREYFESNQWRVLVPFFKLDDQGRAQEYHFHEQVILPWLPWPSYNGLLHHSAQPSKGEGGYAEVTYMRIDPLSHAFRDVLETISLNDDRFALKVLYDSPFNNDKQYKNEVEQLKHFSGLVHDHLITALATFTLGNKFHFLFPFADFALDQYWSNQEPEPIFDVTTVQWVSKQLFGLMAALNTMHEPYHLHHLAVKKYCRHGDIKPDNILWFNSSKDARGILVISDMGLSALNSANSRSNIPGRAIPGAPGYRPPECEVEGGQVSRDFDVWTMGCLFLELITWLLGGHEMLNEFQEHRSTVYINGTKNDIFFSIKEMEGETYKVAQVKVEVTQWFVKLHSHEKCSQFIHDVLDVVEDSMIIVLSKGRRRASSTELKEKFKTFHSKCMSEQDGHSYCIDAVFREKPPTRVSTPVQIVPNEVTEKTIDQHRDQLQVYSGETRLSISTEELKRME